MAASVAAPSWWLVVWALHRVVVAVTDAKLQRIDKAQRVLIDGRLIVAHVNDDLVFASCRGFSGEFYALGHDAAKGGWYCNCEARTTCAHLKALQLVTVRRSSAWKRAHDVASGDAA